MKVVNKSSGPVIIAKIEATLDDRLNVQIRVNHKGVPALAYLGYQIESHVKDLLKPDQETLVKDQDEKPIEPNRDGAN
jgi:hypothetical protein